MRVSLNWLKEYVDVPVSAVELADRLTLVGVAVEAVDEPGREIEGVHTGRVLEIKRHPNADRLVICKVDAGRGEPAVIVTGANNMQVGDIVPVALAGARLAGGLVIKRAKFRGVPSSGMLCAADELGIGDDHEGILILPPDLPVGVDVKPLLGLDDSILDMDLTPNRSDCLSILGVAREVATIFDTELRPVTGLPPTGSAIEGVRIDIEDPELCGRYVARMLKDVKIEPSPPWMQQRLTALGVRPISSIVDVTNYVMLELGQPMHAFDFDRVTGGHVIVRRARPGERMVTLDGVERQLTPEMLLIADPEVAIGIAGVMGGLDSEVTNETRTVLLESAYFNPISIRRTARELGLRSEASLRFEKGIDPDGCLRAANRAVELLERIGAAKAVSGAVDNYPAPYVPRTILVRPERVDQILGVSVPRADSARILHKLEFAPREADEGFLVSVPGHRPDVMREIDLIEEVARIYGYDRIESTLPYGAATPGFRTPEQMLLNQLRGLLAACGLTEVVTYSFVHPGVFDRLGLPADHALRDTLPLQNPLSEDQSVMRTLLFPGLLETLARNYHRRNVDAALFEVATVFRPRGDDVLPEERLILVIAMMGGTPDGWNLSKRPLDFYQLKGVLETVAQKIGLPPFEYVPAGEHPSFHPGRAAWVKAGDTVLGVMGELHPDVIESFELPAGSVACELDFDQIIRLDRETVKRYEGLPRYPSVERDLAFVIQAAVPVQDVVALIQKGGGPLLQEVNLFDVYQGKQVGEGYRSLAFALRFQAPDRTLTDDEVNGYLEAIVQLLTEHTGATLRK